MNRALSLLVALLAMAAPVSAQPRTRTAPAPLPAFAITGARLRTGEGAPVENATVVVRGERIISVGAGAAAPSGATVIDATGLTLTAGFVSLMTPIGLAEIELESSTRDTGHEGDDADAIRAAFSAADGYNPLSVLIPVARLGGITTALSVPDGGFVPGTSAWVDLAGRTPASVREPLAALHVNFDDDGFTAEHGARSAAMLALRELFDDARLYARSRAQYDRGEFRDTDISRLDLERVVAALNGEIPVVVRTARSTDILRVIALAAEYDLRLVLAGAEEGWMVAQEIADAHVPVIIEPLVDLPTRFSAIHQRYDNAALLSQHGVDVMLMAPGAWDIRNLRQEAGNAVAAGMDWDAALRGVTSIPARVFGMDADYGSVAPGKLANLVLWSGDPFELTTAVRRVIVRGSDLPLRSRQTELFERYRTLETTHRGYREDFAVPAAPPQPEGEREGDEGEAEAEAE